MSITAPPRPTPLWWEVEPSDERIAGCHTHTSFTLKENGRNYDVYSGGPERVENEGWGSLGIVVRERSTNRQWVPTYEGVLDQFTAELTDPELRRGEVRPVPDRDDL